MNVIATMIIGTLLIFTAGLAVLASPIADSFAQGNDTTTGGNQSSSANNTGWSNQTDSEATGNISLFGRL